MKEFTKTIQIKVSLTDAEKLELLQQITDADAVIKEKGLEVEDLNEAEKVLKEDIKEQREIMSALCNENKMGYRMKNVNCSVTYSKNIATYTDVETGEVVDEHPLTSEEQLQLSQNRRDVEDLIREDTKNQN